MLGGSAAKAEGGARVVGMDGVGAVCAIAATVLNPQILWVPMTRPHRIIQRDFFMVCLPGPTAFDIGVLRPNGAASALMVFAQITLTAGQPTYRGAILGNDMANSLSTPGALERQYRLSELTFQQPNGCSRSLWSYLFIKP